MKRTNRTEVLATYLGWDIAEVREHRYQPSRNSTAAPVWAFEGEYYTVTVQGGGPPKNSDWWQWTEVTSHYIASKFAGARVWLAGDPPTGGEYEQR